MNDLFEFVDDAVLRRSRVLVEQKHVFSVPSILVCFYLLFEEILVIHLVAMCVVLEICVYY